MTAAAVIDILISPIPEEVPMRHVRLLAALVAVVLLPLLGRAALAHAAAGTSHPSVGSSVGPSRSAHALPTR